MSEILTHRLLDSFVLIQNSQQQLLQNSSQHLAKRRRLRCLRCWASFHVSAYVKCLFHNNSWGVMWGSVSEIDIHFDKPTGDADMCLCFELIYFAMIDVFNLFFRTNDTHTQETQTHLGQTSNLGLFLRLEHLILPFSSFFNFWYHLVVVHKHGSGQKNLS